MFLKRADVVKSMQGLLGTANMRWRSWLKKGIGSLNYSFISA